MASTVGTIKTAIKTLLDATGDFGSVYTDCRERIEKPSPASVMMFHDAGSQEIGTYDKFYRTSTLIFYLFVPRLATNGDAEMQQQMDESLEDLLGVFVNDPTLSGTVHTSFAESWDISTVTEPSPTVPGASIVTRMLAEVRVAVRYEVT